MTPDRARPFCGDKAAAAAFDRWVIRLHAIGIELQEADIFVIGLLASREARLEGLVTELRKERDADRRLRVLAAERLACQDMARALDQAERIFGASVAAGIAAAEEHEAATGTEGSSGRVIAFAPKGGLSPVAQRIAAVVAKVSRAVTKDALQRRVPASKDDFLRGLRAAIEAGAVVRSGHGRKGDPFVYSRGAL